MKEWPFRLATGIGVVLAAWVLWGQFGDSFGLPRLASGSGSEVAQSESDFQWEKSLRAGKTIEIKGINGSITARPASGNRVEVIAVKTSRRGDISTVRIQAVEHSDGVTICAVYPSSGSRENSCEPGEGGRMSVNNNDVQVKFTVSVPKGVRLVARTVNGGIKANGLEGDLSAVTVNGSVDISTTGRAEATTVNGSIMARLGATTLTDDIDFNTVNGSITVHIPDGLNAEIGASTVGGRLSSDFPMTLERRNMHGVLGTGGPELNMATVNGSIQLKRAN